MLFNLIGLRVNHSQFNIVACRHILCIHLVKTYKQFAITNNHCSWRHICVLLMQTIKINISNLLHCSRVEYHYNA